MARRAKRVERPLSSPLTPAERTVGQLVAESIKLYGRHFLRAVPLGLVVAAVNQLTIDVSRLTVGAVALAAVLWLGLVGLAVPVAMREGTSFTGSLRGGLALGRVDYIHAAGALATLVILFFLMRIGLALLLESQADNTVRGAIFLSDAVLAPLLFLGGAILYDDQRARLERRRMTAASR